MYNIYVIDLVKMYIMNDKEIIKRIKTLQWIQ
jgi:hypothetical protein